MPSAIEVKNELKKYINPEKAAYFPRFFKTGPGQYGEGDKFLGVTVPSQRHVAKQFKDLELNEVGKLLSSPIHEHRLSALLILTYKFPRSSEEEKTKIYNFYLEHAHKNHVNNWDLVDSSAPMLVGVYLLDKDRSILRELSDSNNLWLERISVLACFAFIKQGDFSDILHLSEKFLGHKHDLIHKAVGWMLREMGKCDQKILEEFLEAHSIAMPRTMLRYAIEKLPEEKRKYYLNRK